MISTIKTTLIACPLLLPGGGDGSRTVSAEVEMFSTGSMTVKFVDPKLVAVLNEAINSKRFNGLHLGYNVMIVKEQEPVNVRQS